MIEETKSCSHVVKKHFSKELVIIKKVMKIFGILLHVGAVIMIAMIMVFYKRSLSFAMIMVFYKRLLSYQGKL